MSICKIVLEFTRVDQASDPYAFRYAPQDYLLRTPGGGFEEATLSWDQDLLNDLQQVQEPGRDPAVLHRIGEELRKFLAPAGWGIHEQTILRAVREGVPVYLTIRSAAAELYTLPWELLTIKSTGQLIGSMPGVLIRYEWPGTQTAPTHEDQGIGRVLVAWSAAAGPVPSDEHIAAISHADLEQSHFDPERDIIEHATFGRIADEIDRAERQGPPVRVLHLLCHGAAQGSTFGLALDGESPEDGLVVVDPGRLQQLLAPHADMIRLVVLSACDSGNAGELGNHLGSVAQMLHRAGLASVVASRFPLSVPGSERLTKSLYEQLCTPGGTVEDAFLAARRTLSHDARQLDWASIQLYAREEDGLQGAILAPVVDEGTDGREPESSFAYPSVLTPKKNTYVDIILGLGAIALVVGLVVFFAIKNPPEDETFYDNPADHTEGSKTTDRDTRQGTTAGATTETVSTGSTTEDDDTTTGKDDPSTTGQPEKPVSTTKTVRTTNTNTASSGTPGKCPARLEGTIKNALATGGGGTGQAKITVKLTIDPSGTYKVNSANGAPNAKSIVTNKLDQVSESSIRRSGIKKPCKMTYTWTM